MLGDTYEKGGVWFYKPRRGFITDILEEKYKGKFLLIECPGGYDVGYVDDIVHKDYIQGSYGELIVLRLSEDCKRVYRDLVPVKFCYLLNDGDRDRYRQKVETLETLINKRV